MIGAVLAALDKANSLMDIKPLMLPSALFATARYEGDRARFGAERRRRRFTCDVVARCCGAPTFGETWAPIRDGESIVRVLMTLLIVWSVAGIACGCGGGSFCG